MKKIYTLILLLSVFLNSYEIRCQSQEEEAIKKVIEDLFEGMRRGDSSMVSVLFHPDVRMMTSFQDASGEAVLKEGSLETFLKAIGTPHDKIWDEKIWNTEVKIDDNLAQIWTDYAFYTDDQFSHCGVDAFQLVRESDGTWRIVNLIDTRRKEPCQLP